MAKRGDAGREEWRRRFESARQTGQTRAAMAEQYGVSVPTVHYWRQRSKQQTDSVNPPTAVRAPGFVKVECTERVGTGMGVTIEWQGALIRVGRMEDVPLAAAVIQSLRGDKS
jgi:hypothetical protein